jgi:hypothetical protein
MIMVASSKRNSATYLGRKEYPNIKVKLSSKRNPQANAILEREHGTIGNMICTYQVENIDLDEDDPFAGLVSAMSFAV